MNERFTAYTSEHLEEFEKLAKTYGVKLTNKYATPNGFNMETEFNIDTDEPEIINEFQALENKYFQ